MNREEARLEIDATTLRPADLSAEARAHLDQDAELRQRADDRRQFDERAAQAFAELPIPSGLEARLLAQGMSKQETPKWRRPLMVRSGTWLAAAAVLALTALMWFRGNSGPHDFETDAIATLWRIENGLARLDHTSKNLAELENVLAKAQAPVPANLPGSLAALPRIGCKTFETQGRKASVICFEIAKGREAHLVVVDNISGASASPQGMTFEQRGDWHIARWSDGSQTYLVGTRVSKEALQQLFALLKGGQHAVASIT